MTCIVAITKDNKVYMGGDSGGSDEDSGLILNFKAPKVFKRNEYIIGYAGSYRFGKLLEHSFVLPTVPSNVKTSEQLDAFMNSVFITSIRKQSKELELDKEELEFDVLVGIRGHLFEIGNDWYALEPTISFLTAGSGTKYALGSLYTTQTWKDPVQRINMALSAAAEYSMDVSGPFNIIHT
jgi:ATP-dependent protease HslVU (ClpYQ) peptidase subunit